MVEETNFLFKDEENYFIFLFIISTFIESTFGPVISQVKMRVFKQKPFH